MSVIVRRVDTFSTRRFPPQRPTRPLTGDTDNHCGCSCCDGCGYRRPSVQSSTAHRSSTATPNTRRRGAASPSSRHATCSAHALDTSTPRPIRNSDRVAPAPGNSAEPAVRQCECRTELAHQRLTPELEVRRRWPTLLGFSAYGPLLQVQRRCHDWLRWFDVGLSHAGTSAMT